jgi:hypothetical protein
VQNLSNNKSKVELQKHSEKHSEKHSGRRHKKRKAKEEKEGEGAALSKYVPINLACYHPYSRLQKSPVSPQC